MSLSVRLATCLVLTYLLSCHALELSFDPREATIHSTHNALFTGLTDCRTIVNSFLSRIEALNNHTNAIISLDPTALSTASHLDDLLASKSATTGALFCIPVLLKDNYDTASMPTTGGCVAIAESQPTVDAPVVRALKEAGAVVLGKTNLHEMALEGITVSSLGGQTINPYDHTRTPGGSSGGSGAAVAASFSVFATGTDTMNSLRSPASANNLFSCRPTRGLVSRSGIMPVSYTQDAIGPIARCVYDVAAALTVMASVGIDTADNTTTLVPSGIRGSVYTDKLSSGSLRGMQFGLVEGFFNRTVSSETTPVNHAMASMQARLEDAGATIVPITESVYNVTTLAAALDTQRYEYRQEMDAYLQQPSLKGHHPNTLTELYHDTHKFLVLPIQHEFVNTALVSSTSNITTETHKGYDDVQSDIQDLRLALRETFLRNQLDAMIYPQQKNLVVKIGSPSQSGRNGILAALTGSPVVTVPAGFSPASVDAPVGVPIGMEILGQPWTEGKLLQVAYKIEQMSNVRRTPVWADQVVSMNRYDSVSFKPYGESILPTEYPLGTLALG
ncbi:amidase signature domain-containing protein [Delphinella strobiligena]|nr:amidase signature domain-containing protein [Delphinella strobiligena]